MDRLSPLDVSFLYFEGATTPMHVGGVGIFEPPPGGLDYDTFVRHVGERLRGVRRYRQKVRWVPGHLANPVWVDDTHFDIAYHVRRAVVPRPGSRAQLRELIARLMSRPLDRSRPLWEIYLVDGLEHGRFAVVTKSHHAMVDGVSAVDVGTLILDPTRVLPEPGPPNDWRPRPEPSWFELAADAVADAVSRPPHVLDTLRAGVSDAQSTAQRLRGVAAGALAVAGTAARPAPDSQLNARIGAERRYTMLRTELRDYRAIRKAHGGTVNDVVLATVAGALRHWLLTRGERVGPKTSVRAMVPVSVRAGTESARLGNRVVPIFVDLPVGEPDPVVRLHQVGYATAAHKRSGHAVGADHIVSLTGFAPPTLHSLAARLGHTFSRRLFNLVVTNVPGPQAPLYTAGARMLEAYPVAPLAKGQAVSVGLTSYDGAVYYGLNADRDAMPDIDVLADCLGDALAELTETTT
ncbi:MAG: WS/DGAT/MGAT family O-acyltransferase [Streptosporangiaceae bacterium]